MKKIVISFFIVLIFFASCNNQYSKDETKENFFCSGACSKTSNVMVGSYGQILKSTHSSLTWEKVESHTDKHLLDVYYNNSNKRFYVAGHNGTVAFSKDDGITWKSMNANSEYHLFGIATNEERIMVVGKSLILLSSKDGGLKWDEMHKGTKQLSFYDIAFGNDFWIAVGEGYRNVITVNNSNDKIEEHGVGTKSILKGIAFNENDNNWVVVGHEGVIFVSNDNGSSWKKENSRTTEDLLSVAFNGKRFVAVGTNGIILTSKNGSAWKKVQINNSSTFRSISCTDTHWLAITIDGKKEIIEDSKIE